MQVIRTVIWITITAVLVGFIAMNWERAPVNIWPTENGYLHFEWPVGVIALVFFVLGLLPMWLLHRAGKWRMNRRIASLENTVRANAITAAPSPAPSVPPPLVPSDPPGAIPADSAATQGKPEA